MALYCKKLLRVHKLRHITGVCVFGRLMLSRSAAAAGRVTQEMQEESLDSGRACCSALASALPSASLRSVGIPAQPRALLSAMNVPVDRSLRCLENDRPRVAWQTTVCAICISAVMVRPL